MLAVHDNMMINSGVLAYIKAFRQRADSESIRSHVLGKYIANAIRSAKISLWENCKDDLGRLKLEMKVRRSSSTRPQELADLDDILEAFDVLDSDNCLPEIVCSAEDLLQMPQLLPLCSSEKVAEEMRHLRDDVCSRLDTLDKRLQQSASGSTPASKSLSSASGGAVVGAVGSAQKLSADPLERRSNIILFGVSETEDLSIVSDVLKVAAGTKVAIKDMFRLGKKPRRPLTRGKQSGDFATGDESSLSSHQDKPARPRPILVKLSCPWDRRVILAGKMKLSESEGMENYFLQPDLSLEERQKRRADYLARKSLRNVARVSPGNV
ncbi:MAG: hypothetical protein OXU61_02605 [Gammaproteobacteria bacterium]|nr:hypothetical protein [Gammaproteobacteria bacterium]